MKVNRHSAFGEFLNPIEVDHFFEDIFEQRPMLVRRENPAYYTEILNLADIDEFLRSPVTAAKYLRVHKAGEEISPSKWSRGDLVNADKVSSLFAKGATVIINGAHKFFPKLAVLTNYVEQQLRFAVQPNVYITPAGYQGFDRHYDDHDVFIVQVHGTKRWRLYGSPIDLPSRTQKHEWGKYVTEPILEDFELLTGDLLYIPRGHLHDAVANVDASIHITLGLHPIYLFELVEKIARNSRDSSAFRRSLPRVMKNPEEFAERMKTQLHALIEETDIIGIVEGFDQYFVTSRNPGRQTSFQDLLSLPALDETMVVTPDRSLLYRLDRDGEHVYLRLPAMRLEFPAFMADPLRKLLDADSMRVADIPGLLDQDGRIAVAKQLIEAGVLHLGDRTAP